MSGENNLSYDNLEVKNGTEAIISYANYKNMSKEELEELREYLVNNKPNYNQYNEDVCDVIKLMKSVGGYAVFAHPQKCNLTKEEFEKKYKDYQIEEFSSKQINLYTQVAGICPEHYLVGESEGIINIYKINEKGETELYETTNVSLEYLPVEDQEKIKSGIEAIGQENLNQILENLES